MGDGSRELGAKFEEFAGAEGDKSEGLVISGVE